MRQQHKFMDNTNPIVGVEFQRGRIGGNARGDSNYIIAGSNIGVTRGAHFAEQNAAGSLDGHVIAGSTGPQRRSRTVDYFEPHDYTDNDRTRDLQGGNFFKDTLKSFLGMGVYQGQEPEIDDTERASKDDTEGGSFGNFLGSTIRTFLGGSTAKKDMSNELLLEHITTLMGRVTKLEEELEMVYTKADHDEFMKYQLKLFNKLNRRNTSTRGGEIAPKHLLGSDPVSLPPSSIRLSASDF